MTMLIEAPQLVDDHPRPTTTPKTPGTPTPTAAAAATTTIAARAVNAVKHYGNGNGNGKGKGKGNGNTSVRALDGVTVALERHRFTAIMGPSGSGKSTLMHCLAGLDTLSSGQVYLGEHDLGSLSERALARLRRDRLGFIFQSYNLIPTLTAAENITLPMALARRRPDPAWLDLVVGVLGLGDRLHHRPSELSGGQQLRVAAARALVARPEIIFADEPTGNLDSRAGAALLGFLRRAVNDFGQTIVMVTHDLVAASYADQIVFLADGRVADDRAADQMLERRNR